MSAFLGFWDRVELWLVTLPFALQVLIMTAMGIPLFLLVATVVERVSDLIVRGMRGLVAPSAAGDGKEVR